jgi:hypothetical protein
MKRTFSVVLAAAAVAAGAGCGSSDKPPPKAPASGGLQGGANRPVAAGSNYNPKIDPAKFTTKITNRYWPLKPGRKWVYNGQKDGAPERVEVAVTRQKKKVLGVNCVVVSDIVTSNHTLTEKTVDWYAQDEKGDIWYFGEDTKEYKNGVVTSTQGTWEAGVDNAKPGIAVHGHPRVGGFYRQEYRPGIAEDEAKVLTTTAKQTVPAGTFRNVLETRDIDPLNPAKVENKWFAAGRGPVHVLRIGSAHKEEIKLVRMTG